MDSTNPRFVIYIKDHDIRNMLHTKQNRSEYVERAIRFYEENKDVVSKLANILLEQR